MSADSLRTKRPAPFAFARVKRASLAVLATLLTVVPAFWLALRMTPESKHGEEPHFLAQVGHELPLGQPAATGPAYRIVIGSGAGQADLWIADQQVEPVHVALQATAIGGELKWSVVNLNARRKTELFLPRTGVVKYMKPSTDGIDFASTKLEPGRFPEPRLSRHMIRLPARPAAATFQAVAEEPLRLTTSLASAHELGLSPCEGVACPQFDVQVRASRWYDSSKHLEVAECRISKMQVTGEEEYSLWLDKNRRYALGSEVLAWKGRWENEEYLGGSWSLSGHDIVRDGPLPACPGEGHGASCSLDCEAGVADVAIRLIKSSNEYSAPVYLSKHSTPQGASLFGVASVRIRGRHVEVRHSGGSGLLYVAGSDGKEEHLGEYPGSAKDAALPTEDAGGFLMDIGHPSPFFVQLPRHLPVAGRPAIVRLARTTGQTYPRVLPAFIAESVVHFVNRFSPVFDIDNRSQLEKVISAQARFSLSYELETDQFKLNTVSGGSQSAPVLDSLRYRVGACIGAGTWSPVRDGTLIKPGFHGNGAGGGGGFLAHHTIACVKDGPALYAIVDGEHHVFFDRVMTMLAVILLAMGCTAWWQFFSVLHLLAFRTFTLSMVAATLGVATWLLVVGTRMQVIASVRQDLNASVAQLHNHVVCIIGGCAVAICVLVGAKRRILRREMRPLHSATSGLEWAWVFQQDAPDEHDEPGASWLRRHWHTVLLAAAFGIAGCLAWFFGFPAPALGVVAIGAVVWGLASFFISQNPRFARRLLSLAVATCVLGACVWLALESRIAVAAIVVLAANVWLFARFPGAFRRMLTIIVSSLLTWAWVCAGLWLLVIGGDYAHFGADAGPGDLRLTGIGLIAAISAIAVLAALIHVSGIGRRFVRGWNGGQLIQVARSKPNLDINVGEPVNWRPVGTGPIDKLRAVALPAVVAWAMVGLPLFMSTSAENYINLGLFKIKPAEFAGVPWIFCLSALACHLLATAGSIRSVHEMPPLDVLVELPVGKPMRTWWKDLLFPSAACVLVCLAFVPTSAHWLCVAAIAYGLGTLFALGAAWYNWPEYGKAISLAASTVIGMGTLLFILFGVSGDLGPTMVVGMTTLAVAAFALAAAPTWPSRTKAKRLAQRSLRLLVVIACALGLTIVVVRWLPQLLGTQTWTHHVLERARQRALCYARPEQFDYCEQLVRSVAMFARLGGDHVPRVANMHSDLAFASLRAMYGPVALWTLFATFGLCCAWIVAAWRLCRGAAVHAQQSGGVFSNSAGWRAHYLGTVLVGFAFLVGLQATVHVTSSLSLYMMTGVTYPFVSYGGGSVLACCGIIGLVLGAILEGGSLSTGGAHGEV